MRGVADLPADEALLRPSSLAPDVPGIDEHRILNAVPNAIVALVHLFSNQALVVAWMLELM